MMPAIFVAYLIIYDNYVDYRKWFTVCLLFTVYCLLFTVYCLLFTVYCLLFTVYCLLFTA